MQRLSSLSMLAGAILAGVSSTSFGSTAVDDDQLGAWYMYFWQAGIEDSAFGFQGDVQYRNWDLIGDLEQLLIRGGLSWEVPDTSLRLTLGVAHITTGTFGSSGDTTTERRIYQELAAPHRLGSRYYFLHRLRLEQRDVDDQSWRNRFRYFLGLNIPLNRRTISAGTVYLAAYNEIFLNLERDIGGGRQVDYYDRNRTYLALGYGLSTGQRIQFGYMRQDTDALSKDQLQLSFHHAF